MKKLFGTDGMRGEAGRFPLDAATMRTTANSLARHLAATHGGRAPRIVIGRDTRESGAWIEAAFVEGVRAAGAVCEAAGVITTPGVAYLTRTLPADAGVVISASHNPFQDNGIKIFSPTGRKLDDATERLIEADIHAAASGEHESEKTHATQDAKVEPPVEDDSRRAAQLRAQYLDYLAVEVADGLQLRGLHVVADCADGAASELAPALLERLGAHVVAINHAPDGRNINRDGGSLHMEGLRRRVVE
ncbi:MAG: phosphoglucosamine mutase, partial [Acidobacteria bacterium]|nr:phosphoglucosamine mutase [Acidobacteriota bacterium]